MKPDGKDLCPSNFVFVHLFFSSALHLSTVYSLVYPVTTEVVIAASSAVCLFLFLLILACKHRSLLLQTCFNGTFDSHSGSNESANDVVLDGAGPHIVRSVPVPMTKPKKSIVI